AVSWATPTRSPPLARVRATCSRSPADGRSRKTRPRSWVWSPSLSGSCFPFPPSRAEALPCQRDRAVNDHLLAQRRGHDVGQAGERLEHAVGDEATHGGKKQFFAHERDAATNYNPSRAEQGDDVANCCGQVGPG